MKKWLLVTIVMLLTTTAVVAQKGAKSIGSTFDFGLGLGNYGSGLKFTYNPTDRLRIAPSVNLYLSADKMSAFIVDADMHQLVTLKNNESVKFYAIGGISFHQWGIETLDYLLDDELKVNKGARVGANIGGGVEYVVIDDFAIMTGELKYRVVKDFSQVVLSIGFSFLF